MHTNTLSTLMEFIEKEREFNISVASDELWLNCIERTLGKIRHYASDDKQSVHDRLLTQLDKTKGYDEKKKMIKEVIVSVFT